MNTALDLHLRKTHTGRSLKRRRTPLQVKHKQIEIPADTFDTVADEFDNFLGIGKKAQARKQVRVDIRNQKKLAKIEDRSYKKKVKADALAKRYSGKAEAAIIQATGEAQANNTLAAAGIVGNPVQQQIDLGTKALDTVGTYLGGQQPQQLQDSSIGLTREEDYPDGAYPEPQSKSNTMIIVIVAIAAIAFFMLGKK